MKKKLLFKNSTQYSKKLYDEFIRFHNDKNSLSYDLFTIFIFSLLVYCIIATIRAKIIPLALLFGVVLIVFTGYRVFNPIYFYKKEVTKKAITNEKTFHFYFYENSFKIRDNLNFDKVSYFRLYKVYETQKYFFLYINRKYSFIINKECFTQGSSDEFSRFIKNKMKFKYSKYEKKANMPK